jgi:hypothetical protein
MTGRRYRQLALRRRIEAALALRFAGLLLGELARRSVEDVDLEGRVRGTHLSRDARRSRRQRWLVASVAVAGAGLGVSGGLSRRRHAATPGA